MPLMDCPDCGSIMSTAAAACPKCGRPNKSFEATAERAMGIGNVIMGFAIIGALAWGAYAYASYRQLTPEQRCVRDGGTVSFAQGRKVCLLPTKGYGPPKLIWLE